MTLNSDVVYGILFMLLAVWLFLDALVYRNREDINRLVHPLSKHLRIPGAILLFIIGILSLLDGLGLLH